MSETEDEELETTSVLLDVLADVDNELVCSDVLVVGFVVSSLVPADENESENDVKETVVVDEEVVVVVEDIVVVLLDGDVDVFALFEVTDD